MTMNEINDILLNFEKMKNGEDIDTSLSEEQLKSLEELKELSE